VRSPRSRVRSYLDRWCCSLRVPPYFAQQPGFAVVYAPLMIALGVLTRIEPGRIGPVVLRTSLVLLLLLHSIYSDPLWRVVAAISWSAAFMAVAFGPLRRNSILLRCASLGCCAAVLLASGVAESYIRCPDPRHA
jgi:glucose-6-phosphate-specific signal transduction histidine kinase